MNSDIIAIEAATDGACSGNPGPGGWGGLIIFDDNSELEIGGSEQNTTNNRMELLAAIKALEAITEKKEVTIYTDSMYLQQGITSWINNWKLNNWRTSSKKEVKNSDLWKRLDDLSNTLNVSWNWVKAHSGHPENERADFLANKGILLK